jgi:hypothetical protein
MKDPQRLSDQTDLPDALREALRGLGQSAPPADAVARIQRSLNTLSVPPGPEGGALLAKRFWSSGAIKAAALTVGAVTAALVATVAMRAPEPLPPPPPAELPAVVSPSLPLTAAEDSAPSPADEPVAAPAPATRVRVQRRREPAPQNPSSRVVMPAPAGDGVSAQVTASVGTAEPTPVAEPHAREEHKPQLPAPEDEAGLLYRAKKAARTDRRAALQMLDQHAAHFPNGSLVEEREVLAIDLLRRMGREAEAKQRSAQFIRHFPHSSYRSALPR